MLSQRYTYLTKSAQSYGQSHCSKKCWAHTWSRRPPISSGKRQQLEEMFLCALRAWLWNDSEQMGAFLGSWSQNNPLIVLHGLSERRKLSFFHVFKSKSFSVVVPSPLILGSNTWEHEVTSYLLCSVSLITCMSLFWLFFPQGAWIASCCCYNSWQFSDWW